MESIEKIDDSRAITDAVKLSPEHIKAIADLSSQTGYSKADIIAACLTETLPKIQAQLNG